MEGTHITSWWTMEGTQTTPWWTMDGTHRHTLVDYGWNTSPHPSGLWKEHITTP